MEIQRLTRKIEFLANQIYTDTPTNIEYALNYQDYNFKGFLNINAYDGSLILPDIYASARDFGNIGAGYVAGYNGLSWTTTKTIFENFQKYKDLKNNFEFTNGKEGSTTVQTEKWGWVLGRRQYENQNK